MYRYFIKFILCALLFSDCSKEKIELNPISLDNTGNFYSTPEQIEEAVVGAYDALQFTGQYGIYNFYIMEVRSDNSRQESTTSSGGSFANIDLFRTQAVNPVIDQIWKDSYKGIQRCNIILNRIDAIANNPKKDRQIGELKFIRALTYFNLVRTFGDVPLVIEEYDDPFDAFELGRTPKDKVYTQIISDLTDATKLLTSEGLRLGAATQGAAYTLLGKVHLTLGNYSEALTTLNLVAGYSLIQNYADIFGIDHENNEESIFEIQFTKGGIGEGSAFANSFTPSGASELIGGIGTTSGNNLPTFDLFNAYENGDLRKDATIGTASTGALYTKKYLDIPTSNGDGENNVIVLRYADVILMKAEALNEQGYVANGEAFNLLNTTRVRAGLTSLTSADLPDQNSFRAAIAKERRFELAFENHRWFDLVRTGKAIEVMNNHTSLISDLQKEVTENKLVFPIPQSQINATNGRITQNLGYE